MTNAAHDPAQRAAAKVVGACYVFAMAAAIFAEAYVRAPLIVARDAVHTSINVQGHELLWRVGIAADVLVLITDTALIAALYVVLRPVNRSLALLATFLRLIETSIGAFAIFYEFDAIRLLGQAPYLASIPPDILQALARSSISASGAATNLVFVFLGLGSALFAVLWLRSGYVPRSLAILGVVGSVLIAVGSFVNIVVPASIAPLGVSYMLPIAAYEVSLGCWLLARPLR